jgi:hypothetical protein
LATSSTESAGPVVFLKGQLTLERHGRTPAGVFTRIAERLLAMTAAIWDNWRTHPTAPAKRSLIAYDH